MNLRAWLNILGLRAYSLSAKRRKSRDYYIIPASSDLVLARSQCDMNSSPTCCSNVYGKLRLRSFVVYLTMLSILVATACSGGCLVNNEWEDM
jgi:hypothetical protein